MLLELQRGQGTGAFATPRKTSWLLRQLAGGEENAGEAAQKIINAERTESEEREAFRREACAAAGLSLLPAAEDATTPRGMLKKVVELGL